jgi:hypothetical protein
LAFALGEAAASAGEYDALRGRIQGTLTVVLIGDPRFEPAARGGRYNH